jgi:hypothetical protein
LKNTWVKTSEAWSFVPFGLAAAGLSGLIESRFDRFGVCG